MHKEYDPDRFRLVLFACLSGMLVAGISVLSVLVRNGSENIWTPWYYLPGGAGFLCLYIRHHWVKRKSVEVFGEYLTQESYQGIGFFLVLMGCLSCPPAVAYVASESYWSSVVGLWVPYLLIFIDFVFSCFGLESKTDIKTETSIE